MQLDLTEDQIQIRDAVRELCAGEFAAHAATWDREDDIPRSAVDKLAEMGLLGKGATGAAFAGVTALAHMIPGVGMAAPFLGKAASDFVGKAVQGLAGAEIVLSSIYFFCAIFFLRPYKREAKRLARQAIEKAAEVEER